MFEQRKLNDDNDLNLIDALQTQLLKGLMTSLFSDVNILIENDLNESKVFPSHKFILSARSNFFKNLLENTIVGKDPIEIPFTINHGTFEIILKYLYTGRITLHTNNVMEIYKYAKKFELHELQRFCNQFLKSKKNSENACLLLLHAIEQNDEEFQEKCIQAIEENTKEALTSPHFLHLPPHIIESLVKNENLTCDEIDLFNAIVSWWFKNQQKCDVKFFNHLMQFIKFPTIPPKHLPHIQSMNLVPKELILEAYRYNACPSLKDSTFSNFRFKPRDERLKFFWNNLKCGEDIELSDDKLTAFIRRENICKYQIVLGNTIFRNGIHFWEVQIDECSPHSHIMIGVMRNDDICTLTNKWLGQDQNGYSWFGYNGTKYHNSISSLYGDNNKFGKGDCIGVKLDLVSHEISFYKNGNYCGVAFKLKKEKNNGYIPAASLRESGDKITLKTNNLKYKIT